MLGLNFDQAGTNSAMKHVLVLSAKTEEEWAVKFNTYGGL